MKKNAPKKKSAPKKKAALKKKITPKKKALPKKKSAPKKLALNSVAKTLCYQPVCLTENNKILGPKGTKAQSDAIRLAHAGATGHSTNSVIS